MRISLTAKIFSLFLLSMTAFLAAGVYSAYQLQSQRAALSLLNEGYLPLIKTISQIDAVASNQKNDLSRIFDVKEERVKKVLARLVGHYFPNLLRKNLEDAKTRLSIIKQKALSPLDNSIIMAVEADVMKIEASEKQYEQLAKKLFDEPEGAEEMSPADRAALESSLDAAERELSRAVKLAGLRLDQQSSSMLLAVEKDGSQTISVMGGLLIASVIWSVMVLMILFYKLKPIRTLTTEAKRISRGDYSHVVSIDRADDLGQLAKEFDAMRISLIRRDEELAKKRDELLRSERLAAVGRMASHVAHEIRNPLLSISLNAEMLLDELLKTDGAHSEKSEALNAIIKETERLSALTEEYLQFARMPQMEKRALNAAEALKHAVSVMKPVAAGKKAALFLNVSDAEVRLNADENRLIQAFINLIKNAIEAVSPEDGKVAVKLSQSEDSVEVEVSDNGKGLPKELPSDRLFDPFFSTKPHGTGLGLTITYKIAEEHGGVLKCSNLPTGGAKFVMILPKGIEKTV